NGLFWRNVSYSTLTPWLAEEEGIPMWHMTEVLQSHRTKRFLVLLVCVLSLTVVDTAAQRGLSPLRSSGIASTLVAQAQPAVTRPVQSQTTAPVEPSLHILPIHRAKFLAGARFDFRIEANHLPTKPSVWDITIAGKPLAEFFGTQG